MMSVSNVTCTECGAVYRRREVKVSFRDNDNFTCRCGKELESWSSSRLPMFELIQPGREAESE